MLVWTNGKAIRRYQGQDKTSNNRFKTKGRGWFKATAIIIPIEEDSNASN